MTPFQSPQVEAKFDSYPPLARTALLELRELVFQTAKATRGVGEIEESLKWGEPAYSSNNGSGSTVRMDWKATQPESCALYFQCQTNLVDTFRALFPRELTCQGNRAVILRLGHDLPTDTLAWCIAAALTYHLNKAGRSGRKDGGPA